MTLLFDLIIINTIWCLTVKIATHEDMIFEKLGIYAQKKVDEGNRIWEALVVCEFCIPSIHSLVAYGLAIGIGLITVFEWRLVFMWPLVVGATSILCGTIFNLIELLLITKNKQ